LSGYVHVVLEDEAIPKTKGDTIAWLVKLEAAFSTFPEYLELAKDYAVTSRPLPPPAHWLVRFR
jgi:hypothetical protein